MYHAKNNWFFEAKEDGQVRIAKTGGSCAHELILTKSEWESVKKEVESKPVDKGRGAKMKNPPPKPVPVKPVVAAK